MPSWTIEDIYTILSLYPKDTTSVFLKCEYVRRNFTIDGWDIDNCEFTLRRGTRLEKDIILFICLAEDDLKIKVVELYYSKEDTCAIVYLDIERRTILCYYKPIGPTESELTALGIHINEYRYEKLSV